jgi:quercetin dioxygenase-like cupin family protein
MMVQNPQVLARRLARPFVLAAVVALLSAGVAVGALINGALPTASFTYGSVVDNSVAFAGAGVTADDIAAVQRYVDKLAALSSPTAAQTVALTTYRARLADYQARYAVAIDMRAAKATNVKTTYSRVPPSSTFEAGWHYHNGPVIVTVTAGTLTLIDATCASWDIAPGHTYIESPKQVLNAKALPTKNTGIDNVEWFTTRLYSSGAIDPVPVAAPCTP